MQLFFYLYFMFRRKSKNKHRFELKFKFKKHKFYVPNSPEELNASRAIGYWDAIRQFTLRVTFSDLDQFYVLMKEAIADQDFGKMAYLNETLNAYRSMEMSHETLFAVGNHFILIDDEANEALDPDYAELKKELFLKYPEVRGFFLQSSWASIKDSMGLSNDMKPEDYLNQETIKSLGKTFFDSISKHGSMSSKSALTNLYS